MQLFDRQVEHHLTEIIVGRIPKKPLTEKQSGVEVLKRLLDHTALSACETRGDLELIARMPLPDELWAKIEGWAEKRSCGCGEALWQVHSELERERLLEMVRPKLDAIFLDKDGKDRPDADQRLDFAVELAEAENPEGMAMFNAIFTPVLRSLPVDEKGHLRREGFQGYLVGLETTRLTKAHIALAREKSCLGATYLTAA